MGWVLGTSEGIWERFSGVFWALRRCEVGPGEFWGVLGKSLGGSRKGFGVLEEVLGSQGGLEEDLGEFCRILGCFGGMGEGLEVLQGV